MSEQNSSATKQSKATTQNEATLMPPVDVVEDGAGITLYADMPGVPKGKLTLQLHADSLTLEGEVTLDMPEGLQSSHVEVRQPRYKRQFVLSRDLDTEKATAEFKNGVLKLRIPKAEHMQPRRIEVQAS